VAHASLLATLYTQNNLKVNLQVMCSNIIFILHMYIELFQKTKNILKVMCSNIFFILHINCFKKLKIY